MCLIVDTHQTEIFKEQYKNDKRVTVWKIIERPKNKFKYRNKYVTFFQETLLNGGWFKAKGELSKRYLIYDGVIHVYRHQLKAEHDLRKYQYYYPNNDIKLIKCEALMKDFIAAGTEGDLCFTKIWIPKSELS